MKFKIIITAVVILYVVCMAYAVNVFINSVREIEKVGLKNAINELWEGTESK